MTPPDVVSTTWFDSLGRWSNLLQGLGSAVIGGLVAAATAYLVVRWTHRSNMRAATEMDARAVVRSLTADLLRVFADLHGLIYQPDGDVTDKLPRMLGDIKLCQMRFATAVNVSTQTIALVDDDFVTGTISSLGEQIDGSFRSAENHLHGALDAQELQEPDAEAVSAALDNVIASLDEASIQVNDLNRACLTWLGRRR
jgi:hypothetical protein